MRMGKKKIKKAPTWGKHANAKLQNQETGKH